MAYVIYEGTGSYQIGDYVFKPGATVCDDATILAHLRQESPEFITVRDDLQAPPAPAPDPEPITAPVPFVKFVGRDGKWYFHAPAGEGLPLTQAGPYDSENAADVSIAAAQQPLVPLAAELAADKKSASGTFTAEDAAGFSQKQHCRGADCGREFDTGGARTNHERAVHPELFAQAPAAPAPDTAALEAEDAAAAAEAAAREVQDAAKEAKAQV